MIAAIIAAAGSTVASGGGGPVNLTEPWETFATTSSVVGGELVLGGYDMSGLVAVQIEISGVTVTTDDSTLSLRFHVSGSPVSSGYNWINRPVIVGTTAQGAHNDTAASAILLTGNDAGEMVGNAATESFGATITVFKPGSALTKIAVYQASAVRPAGGPVMWTGVGKLDTSVIDGFTLLGSSAITAGTMTLTGLE